MCKQFGTRQILLGTVFLAVATCSSEAAVEISAHATQNMSCKSTVCTPTAAKAVLNASDLKNMLASGNVTVMSTGSKVEADDIDVNAAISWSGSSTLSLDAYRSIAVYQPVSVNGLSGLSLTTNDGGKDGTLWFSPKGHVTFKNLSSQLSINGASFALVGDIKTLVNDVIANANGKFALASSYNAKSDGTYSTSPVSGFGGVFTGLGNAISNLSINDTKPSDNTGLFFSIYAGGTVANLSLTNVSISGPSGTSSAYSNVGALVGTSSGLLFNNSVTGQVSAGTQSGNASVGGLVGTSWSYQAWVASVVSCSSAASVTGGANVAAGGLVGDLGGDGQATGSIVRSVATGTVSVSGGNVGGLVGWNGGSDTSIATSYATGDVAGGSASFDNAGGLVGGNWSGTSVTNSYATGDVASASYASAGGLMGYNAGVVSYSYSTGAPTGAANLGGMIGYDGSTSSNLKDNYWDTTTSGVTDLSQGAGNVSNDPGITGLSNKQLQSKLPKGFSKKVWKESGKLNDGLPYLIANPAAK
jgi:hypothetical protein